VTSAELEVVIARLESASSSAADTPSTAAPDDAAWEALRVHLRQTAQRIVKRNDADDVVQTVLLKLQAPGALRRLRAAGSPRGYLAVMLRNAYVDLLRTRSERAPVIEEPVDERPLPTELLADAERTRRLASFTATLSEADRELLWLRYWRDLSIAQDCRAPRHELLGSRGPMFRILARLRSLLGSDAGQWL
jgi:RNA polymerase sigma factor (sigma-70 family)